jgi:ferredoxin-NADP reductase
LVFFFFSPPPCPGARRDIYKNPAGAPRGAAAIAEKLPDYKARLFYVSGPYGFVKTVRQELISLGVGVTSIKSDYFPGYG